MNRQIETKKEGPAPKSVPEKKDIRLAPKPKHSSLFLEGPSDVDSEEMTVIPSRRGTRRVPMPGTPCSIYGCQKNEYGICTSCARIRPWLERPPGYFLGAKSTETKKMAGIEELFDEVDQVMGIGDECGGDERCLDEVLESLEGL